MPEIFLKEFKALLQYVSMLPEIEDVSKRRKRLGIRQKELAKLAGVSQSFVAKLESGRIQPSYSNMKHILEVLESKEHEEQVTAKDIMYKKVIYIEKNDAVSKAIKLMRKHGISQLPVFDDGRPAGNISDKSLLDQIAKGKDMADLSNHPVSSIMEESFPLIPEDTPLVSITTLLRHSQSLLVTKKGKVIGIITKADLLRI